MEGGAPTRITDSPADEVHPSWSPDGTQVVYSSLATMTGQWEMWVADAQQGANQRFIGYGLFPEWSPVSDTIVFQRARERGSRSFSIWTLTLIDGEPHYPTELVARAGEAMTLPTWSRDGREVAFVSTTAWPEDHGNGPEWNGNSDIWVMGQDGRLPTRLTDGYTANHSPAFAADGGVFFTSNRGGHENVWSIDRRNRVQSQPSMRSAQRSNAIERRPISSPPGPQASSAPGADGL
jgi:TolB protein